jgi:HEAT repeat protein
MPEVSIPALLYAMDNKSEEVRWCAADALGDFGPKAVVAIPPLKRALNDHEELVRRCAGQVLQKIAPDSEATKK